MFVYIYTHIYLYIARYTYLLTHTHIYIYTYACVEGETSPAQSPEVVPGVKTFSRRLRLIRV